MEGDVGRLHYGLGRRVPVVRRHGSMGMGSATLGSRVPTPVLIARAASSSSDKDCVANPNLCEKPVGGAELTIPIVLGLCIPLVAAFSVFFYLHRRNMKKLAMEEAHDPHKSLDFGLGENVGGGRAKRRSLLPGMGGEKEGGGANGSRFNRQQMSMDMNLSSPYLLPPDAHGSQSSLNSLARTLNPQDDPFRPVTQYTVSDAASVRSMPRGTDRATPSPAPLRGPPPRQGSMPRSPDPTHARPGNGPNGPLSPRGGRPPRISVQDPSSNATSDNETSDSEKTLTGSPREPPAAAQKDGLKPLASPTQPVSPSDSAVSKKASTGLGLANIPEPMQASIHDASSPSSTPASTPREPTHPSSAAPTIQQPQEYFDLPKMPEEPADDDDRRGRNMQRKSQLYDKDGPGLAAPQPGENRRLSVGFRPLPPDDIMESEDPEYRANRIRSFYKEYFEDKPGDAPPVPALPKNIGQMQGKGPQQPPHIQDYDDLAAPYFDPKANAFVMPYAQPVARRAMTPPPSGQRFPGPRGPSGPRGPGHAQTGSMKGMPPGIGGPPRPGSSVSNQMGPPRRPGSAASGYGRPRAGSAFAGSNAGSRAGSRAGGPRKPMPPPSDLPTLPAASMMKDEFSIFNAADFAPPESIKDRARGRSQSPAGERRPYQMKVPVHSPLANAFEDLPVLPSAHTLRKSSTFTGLDFAPPPKIGGGHAKTNSDAGSTHSNRSGALSNAQLNAIRNGAGRVDHLPEDAQVFTLDAVKDKLKPSWNTHY